MELLKNSKIILIHLLIPVEFFKNSDKNSNKNSGMNSNKNSDKKSASANEIAWSIKTHSIISCGVRFTIAPLLQNCLNVCLTPKFYCSYFTQNLFNFTGIIKSLPMQESYQI
jgi:hypothetical protein